MRVFWGFKATLSKIPCDTDVFCPKGFEFGLIQNSKASCNLICLSGFTFSGGPKTPERPQS